MHRIPSGCARILLIVALVAIPRPLAAQSDPEVGETIRKLEERLDALRVEAEEIRRELDALKSAAGVEGEIPPVEPMAEPPAPAPAAAPGRSKIFNPDISIIGNVIGQMGDENPLDQRDPIALDEAEMSLQAFVDPYAKASFFIGLSEEGAEVEEGFATFLTLPRDLTAKAGKMKANFGKANTLHFHALPWIDQPLVLHNFFGDEGLNDSGISVSRLFPNRFDLFVEGTAEVFRGDVEEVFERSNRNDLLYVGHVKVYRDLTESSNLEAGASYASGALPGVGGRGRFAGADVTFRWKPLERAIYRSLLARAEWIASDRGDLNDRASGLYASADVQFARRWLAGLRYDRSDRRDEPSIRDDGVSLSLTFRPSEFSLLRGQYRRTEYGLGETIDEFLVQLQFGIGAHGAHTF